MTGPGPLDLTGGHVNPGHPYLDLFTAEGLRLLRQIDGEQHPRIYTLPTAEGPQLCQCDGYQHWYATPAGIQVCWCGHPAGEHLDQTGSCTGVVEILPAELAAP